ncbi:hypothetical protein BC831DRAFT_131864 [Entophlyctis helioformis]|nr:hypothetical protein BC831DRAFT_131864 [Entophlyctis helioformis]
MRFQDDQTLDYSHISNLKGPLDTLLDLFLSLSASRPHPLSTSTSHSPFGVSPTTSSIESTLHMLQILLSQYDSALASLQRARDIVGRIESSHVLQQQRITEWGSSTVRDVHRTRQAVQRTQERLAHIETERDVLKKKVLMLEREARANESLVLEMAKKIHERDERCLRSEREVARLSALVTRLKSQMAGMQRLRGHFVDAVGSGTLPVAVTVAITVAVAVCIAVQAEPCAVFILLLVIHSHSHTQSGSRLRFRSSTGVRQQWQQEQTAVRSVRSAQQERVARAGQTAGRTGTRAAEAVHGGSGYRKRDGAASCTPVAPAQRTDSTDSADGPQLSASETKPAGCCTPAGTDTGMDTERWARRDTEC